MVFKVYYGIAFGPVSLYNAHLLWQWCVENCRHCSAVFCWTPQGLSCCEAYKIVTVVSVVSNIASIALRCFGTHCIYHHSGLEHCQLHTSLFCCVEYGGMELTWYFPASLHAKVHFVALSMTGPCAWQFLIHVWVSNVLQCSWSTYFCCSATSSATCGASKPPCYCAPLVCVLNGLGGLAVWLFYKQTNKRGRAVSQTADYPPIKCSNLDSLRINQSTLRKQ